MSQLLRIIQATLVNTVTIYGVFGESWTVATALALYWSETVIGIVLISARFLIHRAATHKRGHTRGLLKDFLTITVPFTLAHAVFLAILVAVLIPREAPAERFDAGQFKIGIVMIAGVMLLGFIIDAVLIKQMPFIAIRAISDSFKGRILVVHLTIIFGMMAMAIVGHPRALFAVFAALKLLTDLLARAPKKGIPDQPPRWIQALAGDKKDEMIAMWQRQRQDYDTMIAEDELVQA